MSDAFLKKLQAEAKKQSTLNKKRILPQQFDVFTSFVGAYPWQVVLVVSGITAVFVTWASAP